MTFALEVAPEEALLRLRATCASLIPEALGQSEMGLGETSNWSEVAAACDAA